MTCDEGVTGNESETTMVRLWSSIVQIGLDIQSTLLSHVSDMPGTQHTRQANGQFCRHKVGKVRAEENGQSILPEHIAEWIMDVVW